MTDSKPAHHSDTSARLAPAAGLTCVIGDVHGQIRKLEPLLARCEARAGSEARYIFIGDYVDRGPDSRAVVALLIDLQRRKPGQVLCLRGNHEAVVLAAAQDRMHALPGGIDMEAWLLPRGGGRETLASYGVARASELPQEHLDWMASLPFSYDDGLRFYAHAGVRPGRGLFEQEEEDLLWIREPFLSHAGPLGRLVVHGHTPVATRRPDLRANRLNIDTAAGYDGPLTAALFDDLTRNPLAFLHDGGDMPFEAAQFAGGGLP
jgi:serine/threonine protein phosphatase 1